MISAAESFVEIPYRLERAPPPFEKNDIKSPESLARYFIGKYTKKGGSVFDPFAGLGTTLFAAEELKRKAYGIEYDIKRYEWVAGQLQDWCYLVHGDSAKMLRFGFPKMDFCFTSPPYMRLSHQWNPLDAGNPARAGYQTYLRDMGRIFEKMSQVLKKNAYAVVQVDNLPAARYTPLVRDMGAAVSKYLRQEGEVIVRYTGGRTDYPHTHCLVFKNNLR